MRTRVYRCYACHNAEGVFGREFTVQIEDTAPLVKLPSGPNGYAVACPNCNLSNTHAAYGGNVVPVLVIHYEPPLTEQMRGRAGCGHIACDPAVKVTKDDELRYTGEPLVVNCPACKLTPAYLSATTGKMHPSYDVPLEAAKDGTPKVPEPEGYTPPPESKE